MNYILIRDIINCDYLDNTSVEMYDSEKKLQTVLSYTGIQVDKMPGINYFMKNNNKEFLTYVFKNISTNVLYNIEIMKFRDSCVCDRVYELIFQIKRCSFINKIKIRHELNENNSKVIKFIFEDTALLSYNIDNGKLQAKFADKTKIIKDSTMTREQFFDMVITKVVKEVYRNKEINPAESLVKLGLYLSRATGIDVKFENTLDTNNMAVFDTKNPVFVLKDATKGICELKITNENNLVTKMFRQTNVMKFIVQAKKILLELKKSDIEQVIDNKYSLRNSEIISIIKQSQGQNLSLNIYNDGCWWIQLKTDDNLDLNLSTGYNKKNGSSKQTPILVYNDGSVRSCFLLKKQVENKMLSLIRDCKKQGIKIY